MDYLSTTGIELHSSNNLDRQNWMFKTHVFHRAVGYETLDNLGGLWRIKNKQTSH